MAPIPSLTATLAFSLPTLCRRLCVSRMTAPPKPGSHTPHPTPQEAGTTHFSWLAFASFLASILFEALRVVFVERMMARPHLRYNSLEVLVYIGPLTLALLAGAAAVAEREGLVAEVGAGWGVGACGARVRRL